ncbi:RES family NAD+ phosphorylase [Cupriavidus basilensis]
MGGTVARTALPSIGRSAPGGVDGYCGRLGTRLQSGREDAERSLRLRTVWRIATDTPDYTADDRSGAGADAIGGRWSRQGTALVYCASSIALACLQTLSHLGPASPP